jgi:hypothetical protein
MREPTYYQYLGTVAFFNGLVYASKLIAQVLCFIFGNFDEL